MRNKREDNCKILREQQSLYFVTFNFILSKWKCMERLCINNYDHKLDTGYNKNYSPMYKLYTLCSFTTHLQILFNVRHSSTNQKSMNLKEQVQREKRMLQYLISMSYFRFSISSQCNFQYLVVFVLHSAHRKFISRIFFSASNMAL